MLIISLKIDFVSTISISMMKVRNDENEFWFRSPIGGPTCSELNPILLAFDVFNFMNYERFLKLKKQNGEIYYLSIRFIVIFSNGVLIPLKLKNVFN